VAATTRNKAPARWAVLLVSGLASAGFLWGIVNAPGSASTADTAAAASAPASSQQVIRQRAAGDDDVAITSPILPSSQVPTTVQPAPSSQSTQPLVRTGRLRTRGS
jgi:hypothetical protein